MESWNIFDQTCGSGRMNIGNGLCFHFRCLIFLEGLIIIRNRKKHTSRITTTILLVIVDAWSVPVVGISLSTYAGANGIKWEVLAKACDEESPGFGRWVNKHVTGICGVDKWLER
jgi:hypothetical protein